MNYEIVFKQNKNENIYGRYISLREIEPILFLLNTNNQLTIIGKSVLGKPIYQYMIGTGTTKILLWSQMHGNESTTTKALMDFLQLLHSNSDFSNYLLDQFTFCCLPMLNPDGANAYTRMNANGIDLNRDFKALTQPETNVLINVFENFKPDYCYNLHDQRTIYGTENSRKPATISFLSPAFEPTRKFNDCRVEACRIINEMNSQLQISIPNQIGRFDDSFNDNCVGDCFQAKGVPTILFEAGHFQDDYDREMTRKYIFFALISSFKAILDKPKNIDSNKIVDDYLRIHQNKVNFYDIIYKNVKISNNNIKISTNFAIQFSEELVDSKIKFVPYIVDYGKLDNYFGHLEIDLKNEEYLGEFKINNENDFKNGIKIDILKGKIIKIYNT